MGRKTATHQNRFQDGLEILDQIRVRRILFQSTIHRMTPEEATPEKVMQGIETQLAHVWMVRTFIKHSEEAAEDDELVEVHRALYDFMLSLGGPAQSNDAEGYLKQARKKFSKLRRAKELFVEIQPEIAGHTNFQMAAKSLSAAVDKIGQILRS